MYTFNKIRFTFSTILLALILIVSGCGGNNTEKSNQDKAQNNDVTIDSKMGKVTIPGDTEQIIAPYHEDTLLALGITPVVKWAIGKSIQDYLEQDLKDIPKIEWNLPVEQVLQHNPDLIILEHGIDSYEGSYEDYQKIAPTYVMKEETTNSWRKQLEVFGKMLNKEDKAKEVLSQYNEKVKDAKEQLSNSIGSETAAVIWTKGNQFFLFEENRHSAEILYSELGVTPPELVKGLGDSQTKWNPISLEKLSELKADHVFLLATEGEQGIETLKNSSVWQSTPAAKNGNVYILNDPSNWTNTGLIASEKTIEDVLEHLAE
ncbi:iron complex transport system substrate-binding protein [Salinibacillus kushneri]|uniref:Iron complex transport system substrate-binding protein n=1 Tax=Salinibacillus kushneri TaxID=237682 RepID=A0A1I0F9B6_9BACI|nr:iron-hydroxamate ABC transporter substrate-binding protein [Salinibacillus kushneri]SET54693.1 iron complex transport system substrate-binding protein [Salinibacillus kushneri]